MSSPISGLSWRWRPVATRQAKVGGNRSIDFPKPGFQHFIGERQRRPCSCGMSLRPKPFFSGPGIDRADLVRTQPERLAGLVEDPSSRQLIWADGLPAIEDDGRLQWQPLSQP